MIREKQIEEYIPRGGRTEVTIDDCFAGYAVKFVVCSFSILGSRRNILCLTGEDKKAAFVLLNISEAIPEEDELLIYYGKDGRYVSMKTEPT